MIRFNETKLGKQCEFILGGTPKISNQEYWNGSIPWVSVVDFKDNKYVSSTEKTITSKGLNESNTKLLKVNDIIMSARGTVGKIVVCKIPVTFNQSCYALRSNSENLNQEYLYYLMKYKVNELRKKAIGGVFDTIVKDTLNDLDISLPSIDYQKKITSVLTNYDKIIENNTKRIEILEEMAQRIYKEWFVDFKYLGHDNDKLVDSELGMIPEKWKINNLDKYVSFDRGTEPGSKNYQDNKSENTIPFLRVGDLSARNKHVYISKELAKEKILEKKDIVITLDGTVGIVKTGLEGCFSTGLRKCRIINDLINREFLFYTLKSRNIQSTIKAHATGSTILHASSSIKYMKFALPTNKIMNNFFEMINPIISEKQILTDKNYNLSKTRDYLLPKLISGKVDVSDLDIDTCILDE